MTKEQKFFKVLQDIFIGAKIEEGKGGFINLMKIKSNYYKKIEELLRKDIEDALKKYPSFREELFDKLYDFFHRYFSESGSIYFNSTPFHNNIYEKVYTDDRDVILFWKTQMLYYVKTDRIFRSMTVEIPINPSSMKEDTRVLKFYFDATDIENKKANEKRDLTYELEGIEEDKTIVLKVHYLEQGKVTKTDDILKELKKKNITIDEETLERAFRIFEKQSEVDFFINKNAKAFLQEQFKLWSYQYFWEGAKEWTADRVNQLQILKDIAFKIIDFISQFEDELVKIWNKPKFAKNSNYVITLDRLSDDIIEKIINHSNLDTQIDEWKHLGIVDEDFEIEDIFEQADSEKGNENLLNLFSKDELRKEGLISNGYHLPYNPKLVEKARELRKNMTEAEKKIWYGFLKNFKYRVLRQRPIHHFIVDFYCPALKLVIEIDGEQHYTEEGKAYDEERRKILERYGLREIRFRNKEVMNEFDRVCKEIERIPPVSHLYKGDNIPPTSHLYKGDNIPPTSPLYKGNNPPTSHLYKGGIKGGIKKEFLHLPIDTKYFKDLELEILNQFDDLDNALDGWLIKSENYQALNTILPKFKEKVQTIYIDPPFNKEQDADYLYNVKYKDSTWITLLENRLKLARDLLKDTGSIFVRCDYNGNMYVRLLMNEIFGEENFRNEIQVKRMTKLAGTTGSLDVANDSLFLFSKSMSILIKSIQRDRICKYCKQPKKPEWVPLEAPGEGKNDLVIINGKKFYVRKNSHWTFKQEVVDELFKKGLLRINESRSYVDKFGNRVHGLPEYLQYPFQEIDNDWTDILGYSREWDFQTENSEILLKRVIESTSNEGDLVMDFFLGSGTTTAVAHKLGRKWIGVEMGEHFYTVVLPRMKKVLFYDKSGISKEKDVKEKYNENNAGGFFKYYELEQYEETLANTVYENHDITIIGNKTPYEQYIFLKDEKMLKALEIDYENNKVNVDLNKLYPPLNSPLNKGGQWGVDIAETLSNLTGKWIKKIRENEVEFEDGTIINTKDLDYKLIKPLIWWE
jgi:adenine specific DNA methylase Mod/very-short-patch-repair endonuclease